MGKKVSRIDAWTRNTSGVQPGKMRVWINHILGDYHIVLQVSGHFKDTTHLYFGVDRPCLLPVVLGKDGLCS